MKAHRFLEERSRMDWHRRERNWHVFTMYAAGITLGVTMRGGQADPYIFVAAATFASVGIARLGLDLFRFQLRLRRLKPQMKQVEFWDKEVDKIAEEMGVILKNPLANASEIDAVRARWETAMRRMVDAMKVYGQELFELPPDKPKQPK